MTNVKTKIKKIESILDYFKPRYEFSSVQLDNSPWNIREIIRGKDKRTISADSEEGKRLLKENLVKYPKNRPIIIIDDDMWPNMISKKPKQI